VAAIHVAGVRGDPCCAVRCIFMYFNIEISILDYYIVECEVHVLVFVNYYI